MSADILNQGPGLMVGVDISDGVAIPYGESFKIKVSPNMEPGEEGAIVDGHILYFFDPEQNIEYHVCLPMPLLEHMFEPSMVDEGATYVFTATAYCRRSGESGRSRPLIVVVGESYGFEPPEDFIPMGLKKQSLLPPGELAVEIIEDA